MEKTQTLPKIIHAARRQAPGEKVKYLLLRMVDPARFVWYEYDNQRTSQTDVEGVTLEEALRCARKCWRNDAFRTINCGFRYTLPERDEHGCNALFHQMIASYSSANGIYFDEEVGNNCFINFASTEARDLWKKLKKEDLL